MSTADEFEPKILGFLCNWCSYAGADLAGVSRFQYPPTIRVIRVMCSGRVDPVFVLKALSAGLDGVMILGCHPGDCHYATGNYYARNRAKLLRQLLQLSGVNPDRLVLDWVSAAEGERFATLARNFTQRIKELGPLRLDANADTGEVGDERDEVGQGTDRLLDRLAAAQSVVENEQVRWLVGREREMLGTGDVYHREISEERFRSLLASKVEDEFLRNRLLLMATDRPLSVKEMASEVGVAPQSVLPHVVALEQAGLMSMVGIEGRSPKYQGA